MNSHILFTKNTSLPFLFLFLTFSLLCAQPPNNDCQGAIEIIIDDPAIPGTTVGTNETGDPTGCSSAYGVWYTVLAVNSSTLTIVSNTTFDHEINLFISDEDGCAGQFVLLSCDDQSTGTETYSFFPDIGETYYIYIAYFSTSGTSSDTGTFDIAINTPPPPPPVPANNDCANAEALTVNGDPLCSITSSGTIAGATASGEDESTCDGTENDDVWYSFVATATSHEIELLNLTNGTTDLYHSLWSGSCGALTNVLCSDPNSSTASGLTIGTTYLLRVYSWTFSSGQTTTFDVCIGTPAPPPPPPVNDDCTNAITIAMGASVTGSTVTSTNIEDLSPCNGNTSSCTPSSGGNGTTDFGAGVWFTYTSTIAEEVTVSLNNPGTNFDTELQIFKGSCDNLTCVGGDDDSGGQLTSRLCFKTTASFAPEVYFIYVDGHSTETGTFELTLNSEVLPLDLLEFKGERMEKANKLKWTTANEVNTKDFSIEKHFNNNTWRSIGTIEAAGYSAEVLNYEFIDDSPASSELYRLKSMDIDGAFTYSNTIKIIREINTNKVNVYPNPFNDVFTINADLSSHQDVTISIIDITGKLVSTVTNYGFKGSNNFSINIADYRSGIYILSIQLNNGTIQKRIIKN